MTRRESLRALRIGIAAVIDPDYWNSMPDTEPVYRDGRLVGRKFVGRGVTLQDYEAIPSFIKAGVILKLLVPLIEAAEKDSADQYRTTALEQAAAFCSDAYRSDVIKYAKAFEQYLRTGEDTVSKNASGAVTLVTPIRKPDASEPPAA